MHTHCGQPHQTWGTHYYILTSSSCMQSRHYKSLYEYCTMWSRRSWSATTTTLLEHQTLALQTPPAVGPHSCSIPKHASLVPRPRVWQAHKQHTCPIIKNLIPTTGVEIKLEPVGLDYWLRPDLGCIFEGVGGLCCSIFNSCTLGRAYR